jgi:hypothetical protein
MKKISLLICFFILFGVGAIYADLNSGLIAQYTFNGNANDVSGNGNNGTVNGATLTTDRFGRTNRAYNFDGNDYITIWTVEQINDKIDTSKGTISVWVKIDSVTPTRSAFVYQYCSLNSDRLYIDVGDFYAPVSPENKLRFGLGDTYRLSNYILTNNIWYHVVTTWDSDGSTSIYINGILDSIGTYGNPNFEFKDTEYFYLGKGYKDNEGIFIGKIDDIRIYNRALTDLEVTEIYHAELSTEFNNNCDNLSWKLYNGKEYALTSDYGSWTEAQIEAENCGGNLATINNLDENLWIISSFFDVYNRSHDGEKMQANVWIGYNLNSQKSKWEWKSAEPVSYTNLYEKFPQNGSFAYLHINPHQEVGTWNANPIHNDNYSYQPKGIIERTFSGCFSEEHISQAVITERNKWDANHDGKIGLEEAIKALQITAGMTKND